nr:MAG TPA: hypothetical protein [Caudoviricetes sp.]
MSFCRNLSLSTIHSLLNLSCEGIYIVHHYE